MIALWWLFLNLISVIIQGFFSMVEMAIVSINRVRLHFIASQGDRRAKWISDLLSKPSQLFGTTLIGLNVAMFISSECSREFHRAIGLDPNWSPVSQVLIVVTFGELAPMFAARHYPEHVALGGVRIVYLASKIMAPLIWILTVISNGVSRIIGEKKGDPNRFLSQEELQKIFEEHEEETPKEGEVEEINLISTNLFRLHGMKVTDVMIPIKHIPMLPSNATISQLYRLLRKSPLDYVPIYHRNHDNIIGIIRPRDVLRIPDTKRLRDYAKPPWFLTRTLHLHDVLKQFRRNKQNVAVVLDIHGSACGFVSLESILQEIFGSEELNSQERFNDHDRLILKDRTFPGSFLVEEFNKEFDVQLDEDGKISLSELIKKNLSHPPEAGDTIILGNFEIVVKEASFLDVKKVSISTKIY